MDNMKKSAGNRYIIKLSEKLKPIQQQVVELQQISQDVKLQQQELTEDLKQKETTETTYCLIQWESTTKTDFKDIDDDAFEDDDEKETSQKLVIDIPDEDDKKQDDCDNIEIVQPDNLPQEVSSAKEFEKVTSKSDDVQAIITLLNGEEQHVSELVYQPGRIRKRHSAGSGSVSSSNDEERFHLKRRKINADGAPKKPLSGYLRYMHDRRESMRKEHPTKTAMECTKMIGIEWRSLPTEVKSPYLKAADIDKQRYVKELNNFLKSRPDILARELAKENIHITAESSSPNSPPTSKSLPKEKQHANEKAKFSKGKNIKEPESVPSTSQQVTRKTANGKAKRKRPPRQLTSNTDASSSTSTTTSSSKSTPNEIQTNEFLEHKVYDMELRTLRKSKTDLEQQNSVLEKHVENMKFSVEKMKTENNELEEENRLLKIYLDKLKRKLALALCALPLPSAPNGATVDNINKYMQDLHEMAASNSHGPATLNKAKDIIRKLDLQIQL